MTDSTTQIKISEVLSYFAPLYNFCLFFFKKSYCVMFASAAGSISPVPQTYCFWSIQTNGLDLVLNIRQEIGDRCI